MHDDDNSEGCKQAMKQWPLDHIVYTNETLRLKAYWATLEEDDESCRIGLPNHRCGSDHLPIGAVFEVLELPCLSQDARQGVLQRLRNLQMQQQSQLESAEQLFDTQQAALELKLMPKVEINSYKTKKTKPSKEVIELKRESRMAIKAIKTRHRQEREAMIDGFGNLERLLLEQEFGVKA
jgi:hypothetical protein